MKQLTARRRILAKQNKRCGSASVLIIGSSMDPVKAILQYYQDLTKEWNQKPQNLEKCGQLLDKLKVTLTQLPFLPTSNTTASAKDLLIARDILEIGAQWSVKTKNIPAFERYIAQLKCYYMDYKNDLPESVSMFQLLGLNLLFLLSQNRVAEFHTELELLPHNEIQSNVYIRHPVSMEQYLMEGSYNKVFLSGGNVPADSYNFFINILFATVRDEIASCISKAYESLNIGEAMRMLFITKTSEMMEFGKGRGWTIGDEHNYLFSPNATKVHSEETIPAFELASQTIEYAKELEMIV